MRSVAGIDEGLYALVAREWTLGHLPYTTVWETKPPFFFAILAAAMLALGKTVVALRIANDAAIVATALGLYAIGTSLRAGGAIAGWTAALLYGTLTMSDSGLGAVAETFYAPFVVWPLAALLRARDREAFSPAATLLLGASLGAAVLVKESAVLEAAYVAAIGLRVAGARVLAGIAAGAAAAIGASAVPYAVAGDLAAYLDANVGAVARRALVPVPGVAATLDIVRAQALAFFPATLLALGVPALVRRRPDGDPRERELAFVALGWAAVDIGTVAFIREYLGNHFIPAMAPLALLGGLVTAHLARARGRRWFAVAVVVSAVLAHAAYQFVLAAPVAAARLRGDATGGDDTLAIAAYIREHRRPGDRLYVADDRTVLYFLTGEVPPTRFAYPPHLLDRYQERISGADGPREVARILATRPATIVYDVATPGRDDAAAIAEIDTALARAYRPVFAIGKRTVFTRVR